MQGQDKVSEAQNCNQNIYSCGSSCKHLCCREGLDKPPALRKKILESKQARQAPIKEHHEAGTHKSTQGPWRGKRFKYSHTQQEAETKKPSVGRLGKRHRDPLGALNYLHQNTVHVRSVSALPKKGSSCVEQRVVADIYRPSRQGEMDHFGDSDEDFLTDLGSAAHNSARGGAVQDKDTASQSQIAPNFIPPNKTELRNSTAIASIAARGKNIQSLKNEGGVSLRQDHQPSTPTTTAKRSRSSGTAFRTPKRPRLLEGQEPANWNPADTQNHLDFQ